MKDVTVKQLCDLYEVEWGNQTGGRAYIKFGEQLSLVQSVLEPTFEQDNGLYTVIFWDDYTDAIAVDGDYPALLDIPTRGEGVAADSPQDDQPDATAPLSVEVAASKQLPNLDSYTIDAGDHFTGFDLVTNPTVFWSYIFPPGVDRSTAESDRNKADLLIKEASHVYTLIASFDGGYICDIVPQSRLIEALTALYTMFIDRNDTRRAGYVCSFGFSRDYANKDVWSRRLYQLYPEVA